MSSPGHFPDRRWRVDVEHDTRAHAGSATLADPLTGHLLDAANALVSSKRAMIRIDMSGRQG